MKLYELTEQWREVMEQMDTEGEQEELSSLLDQIEGSIEEKADNIAKIIQSISGDVETLKAEKKRLNDRQKALENKAERLKEYVQYNMDAMDLKSFKTALFSYRIQNNPPSVRIDDEEKIPEQYFKLERSLLKSDILKALKNGEEVPGAHMEQAKGLRIR